MRLFHIILTLCLLIGPLHSYAVLTADQFYQRGMEQRRSGDFSSAKQSFEAALMQSPSNTDYMLFLGLTLLNLGEVEEAKEVFERGLELAPDYTDIRWGLGRAYMALKDFSQAAVLFEQAVQEAPQYIDIHLSYARLYMIQENFEQAVAILQVALELNPENEQLLLLLATNYFYKEDYQEALKVLDNFTANHSNPDVFVLRARVVFYERETQWRQAIDLLDIALEIDPLHIEAYKTKADIYIARWNFRQARLTMEEARENGVSEDEVAGKLSDIEEIRLDTERFQLVASGSYTSFEDSREPWHLYYLSGVWKLAPKHTLVGEVLRNQRAGAVDTGIKVKYINKLEKWIYLYGGAGITPNAEVMDKGSVHIGADLIAHIFPIGGTVFSPEYEVRFFDANNVYFLNFKLDQYISDKAVLTAKMYNVFGNSQYYNVWNFRVLFHITPTWDMLASFGTSTEDVNGNLRKGFTYSVGSRYHFHDDWFLQATYTRHQNDLFHANEFSLSIGHSFGNSKR